MRMMDYRNMGIALNKMKLIEKKDGIRVFRSLDGETYMVLGLQTDLDETKLLNYFKNMNDIRYEMINIRRGSFDAKIGLTNYCILFQKRKWSEVQH